MTQPPSPSPPLQRLSLTLNREPLELWVEPGQTLMSLLRERLRLTGAKVGCGEGECGACTILLDGEPVYACLMLALQADGREITTIEGIQADDGDYHPLQQAFIEADAIQCGFCTPGMLLTCIALLRDNPQPSEEEILEALVGNLCRCAGYRRIVQAVQLAARELALAPSSSSDSHPTTGKNS